MSMVPVRGGGRRAPRLVTSDPYLRFVVEKFNQLAEFAESCAIAPGVGYEYATNVGGTSLTIITSAVAAAAAGHSYQVYNASIEETPRVRVRPGNHNGHIPTIGGNPINVKISEGGKMVYPALTVGASDTLVWFKLNLNDSGAITSVVMESGTTLPTAGASDAYQICAMIEVTIVSGRARVASLEGGVLGSQAFQRCGLNPLFGLV